MKNKSQSTLNIIFSISKHLKKIRKIQLLFLSFLTFITSFFEVVTLGAIVPFIGLLISPEILFDNKLFIYIDKIFSISKNVDLNIFFSSLFIFLVVLSAFLRLSLTIGTINLSRSIGQDLSEKVFNNIINQKYQFHIDNTSSEIISNLTQKVLTVTRTFQACLIISSSLFIATSIFIAFSFISFMISMSVLFVLLGLYMIVVFKVKNIYLINSQKIAEEQTNVVNIIQESLGSIRDIIIDSKQFNYVQNYSIAYNNLQKANARNTIYNQSPKYIIEMVALITIISFVLYLSFENDGLISALPILGAVALVGQRLLPMSQQIYSSWSVINAGHASMVDVEAYLNLNVDDLGSNILKMKFSKSIELEKIKFQYNDNQNSLIFKNLSIKFLKGSKIGIFGSSGCGKSTLVDLISGLLPTTEGKILIDGNELDRVNVLSWQKNISYVPQNVFLFNSTIKENILMHENDDHCNENKIYNTLKESQLLSFIQSLPNGINTRVGEKGVKLSGGQKQRIGIARALYKESSLLIFDESTSALDNETEINLVSQIFELGSDKTIIFISHRRSLLDHCDIIYEIKDGMLKLNDL